jgi:hypothetical protein
MMSKNIITESMKVINESMESNFDEYIMSLGAVRSSYGTDQTMSALGIDEEYGSFEFPNAIRNLKKLAEKIPNTEFLFSTTPQIIDTLGLESGDKLAYIKSTNSDNYYQLFVDSSNPKVLNVLYARPGDIDEFVSEYGDEVDQVEFLDTYWDEYA